MYEATIVKDGVRTSKQFETIEEAAAWLDKESPAGATTTIERRENNDAL